MRIYWIDGMAIGTLAVWIWGISAIAMAAAWAGSMRSGKVVYIDAIWAALMALSALIAGLFSEGAALPRTLVALCGGIWGARLCIHLLRRELFEGEDGRYRMLRETRGFGRGHWFLLFQAQAATVALFALPFLAAAGRASTETDGWVVAGLAVWIAAVGGETLADAQLAAFRADPENAGKTCREGLWAWSRHPNYFFEWLHWFAYVLLAVGAPHAWLSWLGPPLMLVFLCLITGIPWTERQALRSRGDYRRYRREVSAFLPWPPRKRTGET